MDYSLFFGFENYTLCVIIKS